MSRMLIVDDEEKIRAVVREYAEFEEFEVTEARDGMEAVNLCLSLIHISEPTRLLVVSRMPSSA